MTKTDCKKDTVSWTLRRYKDDDLPQILALSEVCFRNDIAPEKRTVEHWKWEFQELPGGPSDLFIAEDDGKVVGHYGCMPMMLSTPAGLISARLVVDVMTHPDYQEQGMFTDLGHFSMDTLGQLGSPLAMGFPATGRKKQVMPGHLKVGWFPVGDIPVLGRPLDAGRVARARFSNRVLAKLAGWGLAFVLRVVRPWTPATAKDDVTIRQIELPDPRFDDFWERIRSQYEFIQRRDTRFVKWRFFDSPHREYKVFIAESRGLLSGYAVVRLFKHLGMNGALIVDLVTEKQCECERELLLDEILAFSMNSGADIIACMILDSRCVDALKRKGFMKTGEVYTLIMSLNDDSIGRDDVDDANKWFLTWADFDVL